ncbi:MAG: ProQ/FINO family protein [Halothiobacillaceae bacterium]|nr:ProQ/FINO family protein [Halothiobacillaceae bacterium]
MENLHSVAEAETQPGPLSDAVAENVLTPTEALAAEEAEAVAESTEQASSLPALESETLEDEGVEPTTEEASSAAPKAKTLHPRAVLNILADRFPAAFHADGRLVRPLAVGVLNDLRAAREGENPLPVTTQDLRRALRYYTQGAAYHRAVARGDARINLLGEAVAEVTEDQKAHSAAKLLELEPKLPKRPERAPRPARVGDSAPEVAAGAEAAADTGSEERPRRPRAPMDKRPAGRAPRRDGGRDSAPRNENRSRPPREGQRAAPAPVAAPNLAESKTEATTVVLDMNDKLNLLVAKFGR